MNSKLQCGCFSPFCNSKITSLEKCPADSYQVYVHFAQIYKAGWVGANLFAASNLLTYLTYLNKGLWIAVWLKQTVESVDHEITLRIFSELHRKSKTGFFLNVHVSSIEKD